MRKKVEEGMIVIECESRPDLLQVLSLPELDGKVFVKVGKQYFAARFEKALVLLKDPQPLFPSDCDCEEGSV